MTLTQIKYNKRPFSAQIIGIFFAKRKNVQILMGKNIFYRIPQIFIYQSDIMLDI
jgi:hypothetical protein